MTAQVSKRFPFIEARSKGGKQRPSVIVIRSSFTTSEEGAAFGLANWWHQASSPPDPCHYTVDEAVVYQCVPDKVIAGVQNGSTKGVISIGLCSEPLEFVEFWEHEPRMRAVERAADLVARLLMEYKIPAAYLDTAGVRKWRKLKLRYRGGIDVQITGAWPWAVFMSEVNTRMATLKHDQGGD